MDFYLAAVLQGLCFGPLALGIFISMKIFKLPDITTDGSYTLGAIVMAICLEHGVSIGFGMVLGVVAGALAGITTGLINTKLKINSLLAGILVMSALYSVNLTLLGKSNLPLINFNMLFNIWDLDHADYSVLIITLFIVICLIFSIKYLLQTDFGLAMRATGNNEFMIRALGVNTSAIKLIGLAIANGLVALSGMLISQYQGFADVNMGIGIVISGLGAVIIGDTLANWLRINAMGITIILMIFGAVIFQMVLAFVLSIGISANLLKLCTSVFVLLIVSLPQINLFRALRK